MVLTFSPEDQRGRSADSSTLLALRATRAPWGRCLGDAMSTQRRLVCLVFGPGLGAVRAALPGIQTRFRNHANEEKAHVGTTLGIDGLGEGVGTGTRASAGLRRA